MWLYSSIRRYSEALALRRTGWDTLHKSKIHDNRIGLIRLKNGYTGLSSRCNREIAVMVLYPLSVMI